MKNIIKSLLIVVAVAAVAGGATYSYFSDTETSNGNTFTAGTLDLNVDGGNTNVVKFTVANMRPGSQNIGTWRLHNAGSIAGYVDLENIVIASHENGCGDPETDASDATCGTPGDGEGELQNVVSLSRLFWDNDCDGWVGAGETTIYDGYVGSIAGNYEANRSLAAGADQCVTAQFNWWSTANDNQAQGDSFDMDVTFELGQTTGQ